jgi:excisionase family DNA binding protein
MNDEPLLWNARQAARALGISERKLWDLTQRGEIPHLRIGRNVKYSRAALADWIAHKSAMIPIRREEFA